MKCKEIEKLMQEALAGEIASADREILDRHMADCARCASEYKSLMETVQIAANRTAPEPTAREWQQLRRGIRQATSPVKQPYLWRRKLAPALALAVIMVGLALFVFNDRPEHTPLAHGENNLANERSLIKEQLIYELDLEDLYAYDQEESDLDDQLEELEWML
jgi:anti-sigma factor RsiW